MPVDKALYQAPQGLEAIVGAEPDIEIEIEDPESVTIGVDGMEIEIDPDAMPEDEFNKNLAEDLNPGDLQELAGDLAGSPMAKHWPSIFLHGRKRMAARPSKIWASRSPIN